MARKLPVPEIPPIPRRQSGGGTGARAVPARIAPARQSRQPELPDLLEAFWGDGASTEEVSETRRSRVQRRVPSDPA
jgi:hypothetical protein